MSSRGKFETEQLRKNIKNQLNRLLMQLSDLEKFKEEFESEQEWLEEKKETQKQLEEFESFLERSMEGDMSLVDEFGSTQLAIQAAISEAFKTPDIIRMFAAKQPDQMRQRLDMLERNFNLQKISQRQYKDQKLEILLALKKLDVKLSQEEKAFIKRFKQRDLRAAKSGVGKNVIRSAQTGIKKAQT